MDVNLVTVSKFSSEIINVGKIRIEHFEQPLTSEILDLIYDKYPTLVRYDDFRLYWRYSKDTYFEIVDYISYVTALRLMADKIIYLLLYDFEEPWDDNIKLLEKLDWIELQEQKERERDIYDVKIVRKDDTVEKDENESDEEVEPRLIRTDSEVLCFAVRKEPEVECYTTDLLQRTKLIHDLKKGCPKDQLQLIVPPEVRFENRGIKDKKGKKSKKKKGRKSKKDKGRKSKKDKSRKGKSKKNVKKK